MAKPGIDPGALAHATEHYDEDFYELFFKDSKETTPLLACCEVAADDNEGGGRKFIQRVTTYEGAAVAEDPAVADAISNDGSAGGQPTLSRWEIDPISLDAPFAFTRDEIVFMQGKSADKQFDIITQRMDMAIARARNALAERVSGKGWGLLAVTTAQSSTGFTVDRAFLNRFPVGKRLVSSVSEDTDVLLGSPAGTQLRVTGIATDTGVVTLSGNPVTTWANNATLYIFSAGSRIATDPNSAASAKIALSGVPAWLDPAGATLFAQTRAGDPNLCGYAIPTSGLDTIGSFLEGADTMFNFGRRYADTIFCSGTTWKVLTRDLDPNKLIPVDIGDYKIGFKGFELQTTNGGVMVLPDPFIAPGTAYIGPFRNKLYRPKLIHTGKNLVNLENFDGKEFERVTAGGSRYYKGQFFFNGQLCIAGPGMYGKFTGLPTS